MINLGIKDQIGVCLAKHELTVEAEFVPWSQSRNAGEKKPSLNWKVTLKQGDKTILTTDYSAGMGHCPSYKQENPLRLSVDGMAAIKNECEKGVAHFVGSLGAMPRNAKKLSPDSRDVIYSLLLDSDVLQYDDFESWAGEFGFDEDSRKGEKMYNECLKIALKFNRLGDSVISELREVFQDY